jgi:hypothetical protein
MKPKLSRNITFTHIATQDTAVYSNGHLSNLKVFLPSLAITSDNFPQSNCFQYVHNPRPRWEDNVKKKTSEGTSKTASTLNEKQHGGIASRRSNRIRANMIAQTRYLPLIGSGRSSVAKATCNATVSHGLLHMCPQRHYQSHQSKKPGLFGKCVVLVKA